MNAKDMKNQESKKKLPGSLVFLLFILCIYLITFFFNSILVFEALVNTAKLFFKLIPVLLLVFTMQMLSNKYLRGKTVKKHLSHEAGPRGWFYAIISGILVSGPPYILFPMLADLKKKGMNNALLAVFLYNRNVKLPFLPVMIYYFGLSFAIVLSVYIIIFSILNGLIVGKIASE